MANSNIDVVGLVAQMPDADNPGKESKFTGPAPKRAERVCAQILEGGRDAILDLIGLVHESTDPAFKNYKAEYTLHCVALHVGQAGKDAQRRLFAHTVASQIGESRSKWKDGYLIRELQVAGGTEVVETLGEKLLDDELGEYATQALLAIGDGAGAQLRKALRRARGKQRVTLVQALGVVRDADSVAALKEAVGDESADVRIAASWALANIGDPAGAGAVIRVADRAKGWERIQATKACLLLAEKLLAAGKKNEGLRVYMHLRETRTDPAERYVQEAAEKGVAAAGRPVAARTP